MRDSNRFIQTLGAAGDVMNILSGGMSEPIVKLTPNENAHQLEIRVPGVDVNTLSIEVINNTLNVFHGLEISTENQATVIPRVIFNKPIPHFIDINKIEATRKENKLIIQLPFNAQGYRRKIKINN
jgi:HSP20 family molecular chaperone IbpA